MSHPIVREAIQMLGPLIKIDMNRTPTMLFMVSLRGKLIFNGFDILEAEELVSTMEIEMPHDLEIDATDIDELSQIYCGILNNMRFTLERNGFEHPMFMLKKMVQNGLSLKFII